MPQGGQETQRDSGEKSLAKTQRRKELRQKDSKSEGTERAEPPALLWDQPCRVAAIASKLSGGENEAPDKRNQKGVGECKSDHQNNTLD
jgi:hypothetical protein